MNRFLHDRELYDAVLMDLIPSAKFFIWIATADIKDIYINDQGNFRPLLGLLSDCIDRGVNIRLLHAKEPGPHFRKDFDMYPNLIHGLERNICPRVHLKTIIADGNTAYLGSANLTGAGLGAKGIHRRNFESGIITNDDCMLKGIIEQFNQIWMGAKCDMCERKSFCADPIA